MPDTRVHHAVQQVDQQVDENNHRRHQQHPALHHRIVAALRASISQRPGPGQEKMVSVRMAPASSVPTCRPITVTTGSIALRKRMNDDHPHPRQAFRARGTDIILAQHFQH